MKLPDILRLLGVTPEQAAILYPNGVDGMSPVAGGQIHPPDPNAKTWAEREKEKDNEGYVRIR